MARNNKKGRGGIMELMEFQLKALSANIAYLGGGDVVARIMDTTPQQVYQWQIIPTAITWSEYKMVEMLTFIKKREDGLTDEDYSMIDVWVEEVKKESVNYAD